MTSNLIQTSNYVPAYANALEEPTIQMTLQNLASGKSGKKHISNSQHPTYISSIRDWEKYRYTMLGGRDFVDKYLEEFSDRESPNDFNNRKERSPCVAIAKSEILEVKNSIYSRMRDIIRTEGPSDYQDAVQGKQTGTSNGVDRAGRSMDAFIGDCVLEELLSMGKVGVYIDKAQVETNSIAAQRGKIPYLYTYQTEQILNWTYDSETNELQSVLLKDYYYTKDEFGFPESRAERYRALVKTVDGVQVYMYDDEGNRSLAATLNLSKIPFIILEITDSLLKDIADYQISLTNMESSDIDYILKSNFPFYTEQDSGSAADFMRPASRDTSSNGDAGNAEQASTAKEAEVRVGHTKGRRYRPDMDRPGFIHPSAEPVNASMKKQDAIKATMKQLLHLSISNLRPTRQATDSKKIDQQGLESGLAAVGSVLQYGENEISKIWSDYQGVKQVATVHYPADYSLKSDEQRKAEAKDLIESMDQLPSLTYQKEVAKQVAAILLKGKVDPETLEMVYDEIDKADVIAIDSETIIRDLEAGLITTGLASSARLYPEGEAEKAKKEHAERIANVLTAQSRDGGFGKANVETDNDTE